MYRFDNFLWKPSIVDYHNAHVSNVGSILPARATGHHWIALNLRFFLPKKTEYLVGKMYEGNTEVFEALMDVGFIESPEKKKTKFTKLLCNKLQNAATSCRKGGKRTNDSSLGGSAKKAQKPGAHLLLCICKGCH